MLCQPQKIPHELITVGILDDLKYLYDFFYSVNSNVECLGQDFAIFSDSIEKGAVFKTVMTTGGATVDSHMSVAPAP